MSTPKLLAWFSAGAASAVATKLLLAEHDNVTIYRVDVGSEHPDNERFTADCAAWFGQEILTIKSDKYATTWDVWQSRRYLVGPSGALCTTELKKKPRWTVERDYDAQAFGYTAEEHRHADEPSPATPSSVRFSPASTGRFRPRPRFPISPSD